MNKLTAVIVAVLMLTPSLCYASSIETDKAAHFACSYVICDQLQKNAGFNRFWASATTLAIGAAKEGLIDDHWDSGDFAADCAGVLCWHVKF